MIDLSVSPDDLAQLHELLGRTFGIDHLTLTSVYRSGDGTYAVRLRTPVEAGGAVVRMPAATFLSLLPLTTYTENLAWDSPHVEVQSTATALRTRLRKQLKSAVNRWRGRPPVPANAPTKKNS